MALEDHAPADDFPLSPFPVLAYIDATVVTPRLSSAGDVAIHLLWTAPGSDAAILLYEASSDEAIEHSCVPGDFLLVPPRVTFAVGAGILAVVAGTQDIQPIAANAPSASPQSGRGPTHGLPVFAGYNRQTFGVATPNLALCRWKLTQPQAIAAPPDRPLWLSNLVEPVAISWREGTDLLGRTEGIFLPPGCEVTVIPNDLGYVLAAWVPNLEREVIPPLRSAGYARAEIAMAGVPLDLLG